jgi:hypothetical protein
MPRGVSPLDEARLQGRLWTNALLGTPRHTFFFDAALPQCISVESNGKVSSIQDAFGRTGSFVQTTDANRPVYTPGVASDQASLKFSFSIQNSLISSNLFFSGAFQSVLVVLRTSNPSINGTFAIDAGPDNVARRAIAVSGTAGRLQMSRNGLINSSVLTFGWQAAVAVFNGSSSFLNVNGSQVTGSVTLNTTSSTSYSIGSRFSGVNASQCFNGDVAALVHFNGVWTANEVALLQGYFAWRGGFERSLAASHPYRNRPPLIGD